MDDVIYFCKNVETDKEVGISLEYLIDQKVQILGNSRSGKSRGGRKLAEKSNGKIHQIIISPKKEFVTLREKFDYIHVGKSSEVSKPDIELNTKYAEQLALDIMKVGMDVIIEFSEAPKERIKFVKNFVDGLMMVPQQYWHPTMIMIDEIDIWAPEKGHGEAESLGAIVDLAARGADKGYSLVAITQKLAKFNKDVASELNIKLIGNVSLDTDQNRACEELGIERRNKKVLATLGKPNYYFFAYGPGLSDEVIKVKFEDPITSHIPGWKLNKNTKPIPTPEKVKKLLNQFSNLEVEAEKEIKTKNDMLEKINILEGKLRVALSNQTKPGSPGDNETIRLLQEQLNNENREYVNLNQKCLELKKMVENYEGYVNYLEKNLIEKGFNFILDSMPTIDKFMNQATTQIKQLLNEVKETYLKPAMEIKRPEFIIPKLQQVPQVKVLHETLPKEPLISKDIDFEDLGAGPKKILQAIRMFYPKSCSFVQAGAIASFKPSGGTFGNYLRELKRKGYVTATKKIFTLTDLGIQTTNGSSILPTDTQGLLAFWTTKIGAGQIKILTEILANRQGITLDDLGMATDFAPGGGTFGNYIRELKRLELITIEDKMAKPNKEFFMEI